MKNIILVLTVVLAFGCGGTKPPIESAENFEPTKKPLYLEIAAAKSRPYSLQHQKGLNAAARDLHVRTEILGPETLDLNVFISEIQKSIARKPDGLIIFGTDLKLVPFINSAVDTGIPVVTIDSDLPDSKRLCYIGTDNFEAGKVGGNYLAEKMGGTGSVLILTHQDQNNLKERVDGYLHVFERFKDIRIISIEKTGFDPYGITQLVGEAIKKDDGLNAIVCVADTAVYPAAMAIRGTGKIGKIYLVGMDATDQVLDEINAGVVTAIIAQKPELMSYLAVQMLSNYTRGVLVNDIVGADGGRSVLPEIVYTGINIIDKNNVDDYRSR